MPALRDVCGCLWSLGHYVVHRRGGCSSGVHSLQKGTCGTMDPASYAMVVVGWFAGTRFAALCIPTDEVFQQQPGLDTLPSSTMLTSDRR